MGRPIAKDHGQKRAAILQTAASFFADNGYDRSSMNQLARACGVSKALIYHYYDSKDALLFDIVDSHLRLVLQSVNDLTPSGDAQTDLRQIIRAILLAYRNADAQHKVQIEAMTSLPPAQREALAKIQRQLVAKVSEALKAITPKLYKTDPDRLRPLAMSLFGMINWFYMWHRKDQGITREAYADLITDLVLGGVTGMTPTKSNPAA